MGRPCRAAAVAAHRRHRAQPAARCGSSDPKAEGYTTEDLASAADGFSSVACLALSNKDCSAVTSQAAIDQWKSCEQSFGAKSQRWLLVNNACARKWSNVEAGVAALTGLANSAGGGVVGLAQQVERDRRRAIHDVFDRRHVSVLRARMLHHHLQRGGHDEQPGDPLFEAVEHAIVDAVALRAWRREAIWTGGLHRLRLQRRCWQRGWRWSRGRCWYRLTSLQPSLGSVQVAPGRCECLLAALERLARAVAQRLDLVEGHSHFAVSGCGRQRDSAMSFFSFGSFSLFRTCWRPLHCTHRRHRRTTNKTRARSPH